MVMRMKKLLAVFIGCVLLFSVTACDLLKEKTPPKTDEQFVTDILNQAKKGAILDFDEKEVRLGASAPKGWKKIDVNDQQYAGLKDALDVFREVYESPKGDAYVGLNKGKAEALLSFNREYRKRLSPDLIKKVMGKPKQEKKSKNEVTKIVYEVNKNILDIDLEGSSVTVHSPEWIFE